jgi:uncharacterized protein YeaO (DUF488 family)
VLRLKRAYDPASDDDGYRVLIERLWPRGITKEKAALDLWMKDIAPSSELRKWFGHDPQKWDEFQRRYWEELGKNQGLADELKRRAAHETVTLVYGSRDERHNAAVALKKFLEKN